MLRFSKLFGVGRASSLPKLWRGTRKRKKPKHLQPAANGVYQLDKTTSAKESATSDAVASQANKPEQVGVEEPTTLVAVPPPVSAGIKDDVFKLFDEAFSDDADKKKTTADNVQSPPLPAPATAPTSEFTEVNQEKAAKAADESMRSVDTTVTDGEAAKPTEATQADKEVTGKEEKKEETPATLASAASASEIDDDELVYEANDEGSYRSMYL